MPSKSQIDQWKKDSERLTALEILAAANAYGGLLLHHQNSPVEWKGVGLGMSTRTLREAIDAFRDNLWREPKERNAE